MNDSPRRIHRFGRGLPAADAARTRPLLLIRFLRPQPHHIGGDPGRRLATASSAAAAVFVVTVVAGVVILGVRAVGADAVHDRARRRRQAAGRLGRGRGAVLDVATAREVKRDVEREGE